MLEAERKQSVLIMFYIISCSDRAWGTHIWFQETYSTQQNAHHCWFNVHVSRTKFAFVETPQVASLLSVDVLCVNTWVLACSALMRPCKAPFIEQYFQYREIISERKKYRNSVGGLGGKNSAQWVCYAEHFHWHEQKKKSFCRRAHWVLIADGQWWLTVGGVVRQRSPDRPRSFARRPLTPFKWLEII